MLARIPYVALATLNTTNGTARNGTAFVTEFAAPGAIAVVCSADVKTASVLATFKLQVSVDGTTFVDLSGGASSSISFATAAGTGTTVTTTKVLTFDIAAHAFVQCRVVATLSGATTNIDDTTSATMYYVPAGKLY
jgi:hypothetical protein